jgi:hypothetical protein
MNLKTAINMRIYNARVMWQRHAPIWLEDAISGKSRFSSTCLFLILINLFLYFFWEFTHG